MFVKGHCSPRKEDIKISCLKRKTLKNIANILNQKLGANIKVKKTTKKKLYSEIKKHLSKSKCRNESCWGSLSIIIENLDEKERKELKESFKPFQPLSWKDKPNTW